MIDIEKSAESNAFEDESFAENCLKEFDEIIDKIEAGYAVTGKSA